jgi:ribosome hibernation promoting factor
MKIEYTGRQTQLTTPLRALAERKLQKLRRFLPGVTKVHVVVSEDARRQVAELTAHSRGLDLTATETDVSLRGALSAAIQKLLRQAERQVARRREHKRRGDERRGGRPAPTAPKELRVVRSRRSFAKPMTVDEAALLLDERDERPLVFRDAQTDAVKVLYRRRDGRLGLIEPEA